MWLTCSAAPSISSWLLTFLGTSNTPHHATHFRAGLRSDSLPLAQSQEQVLRAFASHAALHRMHIVAREGVASIAGVDVSLWHYDPLKKPK